MKIMALDPGGTTGVAVAEVEAGDEPVHVQMAETLAVWQVACKGREEDGAWELWTSIQDHVPDVVVTEDFRLYQGRTHTSDTDGLLPWAMISRLEMIWWLARRGEFDLDVWVPEVVYQMPGERMVITDARLKRWGLWRTEKRQGGGPHAMDALRHLIVFARREVRP